MSADIETLELENRMLRARNERLEAELATLQQRVLDRLAQGFGAASAPVGVMTRFFGTGL